MNLPLITNSKNKGILIDYKAQYLKLGSFCSCIWTKEAKKGYGNDR